MPRPVIRRRSHHRSRSTRAAGSRSSTTTSRRHCGAARAHRSVRRDVLEQLLERCELERRDQAVDDRIVRHAAGPERRRPVRRRLRRTDAGLVRLVSAFVMAKPIATRVRPTCSPTARRRRGFRRRTAGRPRRGRPGARRAALAPLSLALSGPGPAPLDLRDNLGAEQMRRRAGYFGIVAASVTMALASAVPASAAQKFEFTDAWGGTGTHAGEHGENLCRKLNIKPGTYAHVRVLLDSHFGRVQVRRQRPRHLHRRWDSALCSTASREPGVGCPPTGPRFGADHVRIRREGGLLRGWLLLDREGRSFPRTRRVRARPRRIRGLPVDQLQRALGGGPVLGRLPQARLGAMRRQRVRTGPLGPMDAERSEAIK